MARLGGAERRADGLMEPDTRRARPKIDGKGKWFSFVAPPCGHTESDRPYGGGNVPINRVSSLIFTLICRKNADGYRLALTVWSFIPTLLINKFNNNYSSRLDFFSPQLY